MKDGDHGQAASAEEADLAGIILQSRRLAARLGQPVGPRELLLAVAAHAPKLLVERAAEHGVSARRLSCAIREWWPPAEIGVTPALPNGVPLTEAARAAIAGALDRATSSRLDATLALADQLLNPASVAGLRPPMSGPESGPPADATGKILSGLSLI